MHAKSVEITRLTIGFVDICSDVVTDYIWLVVWNMAFTFPYIRNVIIPTDELHHPTRFDGWICFFFSRGAAPGIFSHCWLENCLLGKHGAIHSSTWDGLTMLNHELEYSSQKLLPYTPHMPTWKEFYN